MQDTLLRLQRDNFVEDNHSSKATEAIREALDDQLKQLFMLGARKVATNIDNGMLAMLRVNVNNDKLSDAEFRELTVSLIEQCTEDLHKIYAK